MRDRKITQEQIQEKIWFRFFPTKKYTFCCWAQLLCKVRDAISSTTRPCCLENQLGQFFPRDSAHCMLSLLFCIIWSSKNFIYKCNTLSVICYPGTIAWVWLLHDGCFEISFLVGDLLGFLLSFFVCVFGFFACLVDFKGVLSTTETSLKITP